jgi:hypothetical protein
VQITLDRYGHLMDQSYGDASDRLEEALFSDASVLPPSPVREGAAAFRGTADATAATPLPVRVSAASGGMT